MSLKKTPLNGLTILSLTLLASSAGWSMPPKRQPAKQDVVEGIETSMRTQNLPLRAAVPPAKWLKEAPKTQQVREKLGLVKKSTVIGMLDRMIQESNWDLRVQLHAAALGYSSPRRVLLPETVGMFKARPALSMIGLLALRLLGEDGFRGQVGMMSIEQSIECTRFLMGQEVQKMAAVNRQLYADAIKAKKTTPENLQAKKRIVMRLQSSVDQLQQEVEAYKPTEAEGEFFKQREEFTKEHAEVKKPISEVKQKRRALSQEKRSKTQGTAEEKAKIEKEYKREYTKLAQDHKQLTAQRKMARKELTQIHLHLKDTPPVQLSVQKNVLKKAEADLGKIMKLKLRNAKDGKKVAHVGDSVPATAELRMAKRAQMMSRDDQGRAKEMEPELASPTNVIPQGFDNPNKMDPNA